MKKIIVVGCPGSGKSVFSVSLHNKTKIPLYHLDMLFWNSDKTTVEKTVFLERLSSALQGESWIIDGNYASTMEMRLSMCDTVFFLDYPLDVCLAGISERRGKKRCDMPWIETEEDADFVNFVKSFREKMRPVITELLEKYSDKSIFIFKCREEADEFFRRLSIE